MARRKATPDRDPTTILHPFEGRDVVNSRIAITRAGDGLSKALQVSPRELAIGQTVHVVLECEVTRITYDPVTGTDVLARVHRLTAGTATMVEADLVAEVLEEQRVAIEQAQGIERLDFDPLGIDGEGDSE